MWIGHNETGVESRRLVTVWSTAERRRHVGLISSSKHAATDVKPQLDPLCDSKQRGRDAVYTAA